MKHVQSRWIVALSLALSLMLLRPIQAQQPWNMEMVGSLSAFPGDAFDLAVSGTRAYLAVKTGTASYGNYIYGYIAVIDVTNPADPKLLGTWYPTAAWNRLYANGTTVYLASINDHWLYGITAADLKDPAKPNVYPFKIIGNHNQGSDLIGLSGSTGFVIPVQSGQIDHFYLTLVNLANPASPAVISNSPILPITLPSYDYYYTGRFNLTVSGTRVFIAGNRKVAILNIVNPTTPTIEKSFDALGTSDGPLFVSGAWLYMMAQYADVSPKYNRAEMFNWTAPAGQNHLATLTNMPDHFAVSGNLAINGNSAASLEHPFDNDLYRGFFPAPYASQKTVISGSLAYVACGERGLSIMRYTGPGAPVVIKAPAGGESFASGAKIQFSALLDPKTAGTAIRVELWRAGTKIKTLGSFYNAKGAINETLTLPADVTPNSGYTLRAISTWDPAYWAASGSFSIKK